MKELHEVIARKVGVSRSTVEKILNRARRDGLVREELHLDNARAPHTAEGHLAALLKCALEPFGVRHLCVVTSPPEDARLTAPAFVAWMRLQLAEALANYLATECQNLQPGCHLCLGGGPTMRDFALTCMPRVANVVLRPWWIRGYWRPVATPDPSVVVELLHARLTEHNKPASALCPQILPGIVPERTRTRPEIGLVFGQEADVPAVCISAIGGGSRSRRGRFVQLYAETLLYNRRSSTSSPLMREDMFDPIPERVLEEATHKLQELDIISTIGLQALDASGEVVPIAGFDSTYISVDLRTLAAWCANDQTDSILVVHDSQRADSVHAALRGRYFTTLIIDTALAIKLLQKLQPQQDLPKPFRYLNPVDPSETKTPARPE
jgi:DNA-binding transcriptional regulator LsrR (DeoR family)